MDFKLKLLCCCLHDRINTLSNNEDNHSNFFKSNAKRIINYIISENELTADNYKKDKQFIDTFYYCNLLYLCEENYTGGFLDPFMENKILYRVFRTFIHYECLKFKPPANIPRKYYESILDEKSLWESEDFISLQNITNDYFDKNLSHT
jgi:hypothetical protein